MGSEKKEMSETYKILKIENSERRSEKKDFTLFFFEKK